MGKREKSPPAAPPPGPFNAALAGLAARLGAAAPGPGPEATTAGSPAASSPAASSPGAGSPAARPAGAGSPAAPTPARAVVRMERARRGGKTVTVVEKLGLRPPELESWLGDLKRALGCGGSVAGESLVLQGDARERVGAWLASRGVRKVTVA